MYVCARLCQRARDRKYRKMKSEVEFRGGGFNEAAAYPTLISGEVDTVCVGLCLQ